MSYCIYENPEAVDDVIATAIGNLAASYPKFLRAKDAFEAASGVYSRKGKTGAAKVQECAEKIHSCEVQPDSFRHELQDELEKIKADWKIDSAMIEAERVNSNTCNTLEDLIKELRTWAETEVPKCKSENDFSELYLSAENLFNVKAQPFGYVRELYDMTQKLTNEPQKKQELHYKSTEVDDTEDEYKRRVLDEVTIVITDYERQNGTGSNDLLQIYHDFSVKCEALIKKMEIQDDGCDRTPGVSEKRLQGLMALVREHLQRDLNLREQLHVELDETFTFEKLPL